MIKQKTHKIGKKENKNIFLEVIKAYLKNPEFLFLFVLQYAIISFVFNILFVKISLIFPKYLFLPFTGLFLLLFNAFFISIYIGAANLVLNNKFSFKESLKFSKFTFGNFLLMIVLTIASALVFGISNLAGFLISKLSSSNLPYYSSLFFYFIGVLLVIFLSFQNFFYTIGKSNIFNSIKKSIFFVKKRYFLIISILIIYILIDFLISFIPYVLIKEILAYVLIYPILALSLTSLFNLK